MIAASQPHPAMSLFTSSVRLARFASIGFVALATSVLSAGTATVSVNFNSTVRTIDPLTFSAVESGYGSTKLANDTDQQAEIALLNLAMLRINLGYQTPGNPNSTIVSKVAGADTSITGTQWVNAIKNTGAIPQIRVQMDAALPQSTWVTDAANMVTYFNFTTSNRVDRWVIGNEPSDNGHTVESYAQGFVAMYNAMKAVDPTIKIGGPASAQYNSSATGFLKASLTRIEELGCTPDFVIFHSYGSGNASNATLLDETLQKYETNPADFRTYLINTWGSTVGGAMPIEIGEWNLKTSSDARQLQHYGTIWTALAMGRMVKSGVISRFYADKNGLTMGFLVDTANPTYGGSSYTGQPNDPMPAYHGIGMYTGASLFDGFGTQLVSTTVTSSTNQVFAISSNNGKNIVAVNYSSSDNTVTTFNLTGVTNASVEIWQKNSGNQNPVSLGTINVTGGSFNYTLNAYTVTAFVVTPTNPPAAPTGLAATPGNAQVALTWNAVSGATSYTVKRGTTSGTYTNTFTSATNSYTNTGLTNGTTYYYVVSATGAGGESANSSQVSATPIGGGGTITIQESSLAAGNASNPPSNPWRVVSDSNASGGGLAFFDATAASQYVTRMTPSVTAGTYQVIVVYKSGNNRGIYQVATAPTLGGTYTNVGTTKDQYAASQTFLLEHVIGNVTFSTTGTKAIRFTVTGKNASSSGYGLAIDAIKLVPQ